MRRFKKLYFYGLTGVLLRQCVGGHRRWTILKIVLYIIFVIDCIALSAIILLQEGKSAGLGTIGGMADTYWGQNKGRSMEGALVKSTKFLAILFIVLAAVLNLKVFA